MVIDITSFNGEYDLLELRLNVLGDVVDEFIICEATETFSGIPKELFYPQQRERYAKWKDKIKYHIIDDYPLDFELCAMADASPSVPKGQPWWHREFYQKESIKKALTHLKDDDICFVGDMDEIWNPDVLKIPLAYGNVYKLRQLVYTYYLNNRSNEEWAGTYLARYRDIKNECLNHLRTRYPWVMMQNGGWHFTNMGGANQIRRKLESYGHQEFNIPEVKDKLEARMEENEDFIGRGFVFWLDASQWPEYLKENYDKYAHLMNIGAVHNSLKAI